MPDPQQDSQTKKSSKWSPDEDAKIIQLRQNGMTWEDISKQFAGRSATSCRLHYQNYIEKHPSWDDTSKTKLANLYDRYVEHGGTAGVGYRIYVRSNEKLTFLIQI